eukprot:jgi/Chlat1/3455/Chrsp23S03770
MAAAGAAVLSGAGVSALIATQRTIGLRPTSGSSLRRPADASPVSFRRQQQQRSRRRQLDRLTVKAQVDPKDVGIESPTVELPTSPPPKPITFLDTVSNMIDTMLSSGDQSMPVAKGQLSDLVGKPLFFSLYDWFQQYGGVYKLAFGPKAFTVISDPVVARHVLRENAFSYDKGVLAEILEPIMGKGLIPADLETWKVRRRAVVPGFHAAYLDAMVATFSRCAERTAQKFSQLLEGQNEVLLDMESEYSSLSLDIIGLAVFNYDFDSVTEESPIIKASGQSRTDAVYGVLYEAEHRATFYFPYWNFPPMRWIVPRQRKFAADMKIIEDCLDSLIARALDTRQEGDLEALQQRDYSRVQDPSLLRFLVDIRGESCDNRQLRDDLMTMLIAGHETTAAVLTWATFQLAQHPEVVAKAQEEIDRVIGDRTPTLSDLKELQYVRLIVAEALRLYPQPPLLIRRALETDNIPGGHKGPAEGYVISRGDDVFISVYNINRSPYHWDEPDRFNPDRFLEPYSNPEVENWAGYRPELMGTLYPNETTADYAFLPFGGGPRKCVGDQFALMESTVALAMLLRRFNVALRGRPDEVGMTTGATIHTSDGLWCRVTERNPGVQSTQTKQTGEALASSR